MLPDVKKPELHKFDGCMWLYGLDPATKSDYFGVVVHVLPPKPQDGSPWLPYLREAFNIRHERYTDVLVWLQNILFHNLPPYYGVVDATRDNSFAQELENKYGDTRIKSEHMTNPLNYEMKMNAFNFLHDGYTFPNTALMHSKRKAIAIADIKTQCLLERVEWSATNRATFTHPPSAHNDLNRAWEMSLLAVSRVQSGRLGHTPIRSYTREDTIHDYEEEMAQYAFSSMDIPFDTEEPAGTFAIP